MTTVLDANVHNIAIRGTFDDGQRIVKARVVPRRGLRNPKRCNGLPLAWESR